MFIFLLRKFYVDFYCLLGIVGGTLGGHLLVDSGGGRRPEPRPRLSLTHRHLGSHLNLPGFFDKVQFCSDVVQRG